jgi:regulator of sigma E protease
MTIVLFIAVLFFLILVHELGHFLTAKWARMRVDEFAIGFPPRLFSLRGGETEYSINLLPIGGYVKIMGENGDIDGDKVRAFGSRPRLHQAIVLLAGVAMNILTAWVIFVAITMVGTPTAISEEEYAETGRGNLIVTSTLINSPAATANIPSGSMITAVTAGGDELETFTPSALTEFVSQHSNETIVVNYSHRDTSKSVALNPTAGVIESDLEKKAVGLSTAIVDIKKEGALGALVTGTTRTIDALSAITVGLFSFLGSAFTLSANIEEVTGPIGIAGMVGEAAEFGLVPLLIFTAFISLNLAVINLLPIPALDGGRLLFVFLEAIIRRPIDPEWMARVNFIGFAFLILLMIAVTYNDILRLF